MNLLIALQFYEKDRDKAMRLTRMIADVERKPRGDVVLMLASRPDCEPADQETVAYVNAKMRCFAEATTTHGTGWPDGCNAMALDILQLIAKRKRTHAWDFDAVLLIEPDCVPVHHDWLNILISEWFIAKSCGKHLMGAWRQSGPECGHINGNAMFDTDIVNLAGIGDAIRSIRGTAWDAALAPYFKNHWYHTGLISNLWNENSVSDEQIATPWMGTARPVLVHGCKSDDVWNYAKRKIFP